MPQSGSRPTPVLRRVWWRLVRPIQAGRMPPPSPPVAAVRARYRPAALPAKISTRRRARWPMLSLRQRSGCGGGDPHARRREACDDRVVPPVDKGRTELMVRVRQIGHVCLVDARGEIDASTVAELHVGLDGALRARTAVVVDLCAVSFMDSAGLHALL